MRTLFTLLLVSGMAFAQAADAPKPPQSPAPAAAPQDSQSAQSATPAQAPEPAAPPSAPLQRVPPRDPNAVVIPAGTRIPLLLKQAISTKNAREGDAVYAATAFPFVLNERILVPEGTYVQGKISHTQPAGRAGDKRAEI